MDKTFRLKPPTMPNFIFIEGLPSVRKQDGFMHPPMLAVHELSEKEAEEYAEEMKEAFMRHWRARVAQREDNNNVNSKTL